MNLSAKIFSQKTLIIVFLITFIFFIFFQFYSIATSYINSDNAIVGLAARDILKGRFPVFFYGQSYMGSTEALVTALVFWLFGASGFTLQVAPLIYTLFFLLIFYFLAKEIIGQTYAGLAVLILLLGPTYFQAYSHATKGGYIETVFFGTLLFFFTRQIVWGQNEPQKLSLNYFLAGLAAGLAFWTNPLTISYLATAVFFIFLKNKKIFLSRYFLYLAAGFFLGSAPFWIYNFQNQFISLTSMGQASGTLALGSIYRKFLAVFWGRLPRLMGLVYPAPWGWLGRLIFIFFIFVYFYLAYQKRCSLFSLLKLKIEPDDGLELFLIFIPLAVFICAYSHFGSLNVPRYLLPLYSAYPVMLAAFVKETWPKLKYFLIFIFLIIFAFNLGGMLRRLDPQIKERNRRHEQSNFVLIDFFKKNNISAVYCDRWLSERLTFLSQETIFTSAWYKQRIAPYGLIVNASPNPAFVFNEEDPAYFEDCLKSTGSSFKKKVFNLGAPPITQFNYYLIYYDIHQPNFSFSEILPGNFIVSSSTHQEMTPAIFDRNGATFWSTVDNLKPGDYLTVDLKKPVDLSKVEFMPGKFSQIRHGTTGGFEILGSLNGQDWQEIAQIKKIMGPVFWSGPHPFWQEENGRVSLVFKPAKVRYLKILQTQKSSRNPWIVRELFLYSPAGRWPNPEWQTENLLKFLAEKKPQFVAGDYWLSSLIALKTKGRIKTAKQVNEISYEEELQGWDSFRLTEINPGTIFVIPPDEAQALEDRLQKARAGFKKEVIDGWLVYYDLKPEAGKNLKFFWNGTHLLEVGS